MNNTKLREEAARKVERASQHAMDAEQSGRLAASFSARGNSYVAAIHLNAGRVSERCAERLMAEAKALLARTDALSGRGA